MNKLIVFASGTGTNFSALIDACITKNEVKEIDAEIVALIADRDCNAVNIAKKNNIKHELVDTKSKNHSKELIFLVKKFLPDYIILAGYMKIIPSELIDEYPLQIINIHPSLLPSFKGINSIYKAWVSGQKVTGVTVHFNNDKRHHGKVIDQESPIVKDSLEDLTENIHKIEHNLYKKALGNLINTENKVLVVSRCLLGDKCRYNGEDKFSKRVSKLVSNFKGDIIKICPEVDAGMSIPRDIIKNRAGLPEKVLKHIDDLVYELGKYDFVLCVLKENSPSCGINKQLGAFSYEVINKLKNKIIMTEEEV